MRGWIKNRHGGVATVRFRIAVHHIARIFRAARRGDPHVVRARAVGIADCRRIRKSRDITERGTIQCGERLQCEFWARVPLGNERRGFATGHRRKNVRRSVDCGCRNT